MVSNSLRDVDARPARLDPVHSHLVDVALLPIAQQLQQRNDAAALKVRHACQAISWLIAKFPSGEEDDEWGGATLAPSAEEGKGGGDAGEGIELNELECRKGGAESKLYRYGLLRGIKPPARNNQKW